MRHCDARSKRTRQRRSECPESLRPWHSGSALTSAASGKALLDSAVQWPWSVKELTRELGDNLAVEDGLASLYAAGLIQVKLGEAVEQMLQDTGMNEEELSRLFDLRRPLPE
jgi:hypothetical protein